MLNNYFNSYDKKYGVVGSSFFENVMILYKLHSQCLVIFDIKTVVNKSHDIVLINPILQDFHNRESA